MRLNIVTIPRRTICFYDGCRLIQVVGDEFSKYNISMFYYMFEL